MNINRIIADIEVAKRCCYSKNNPTNDEYFYDVAAYHIQQAIEKELKYILHNIYGMDDISRRYRTHNISTLIIFLEKYDTEFIQEHQKLVDMADTITEWEASCRYGENIVSTRRDIEKAVLIADSILSEIQALDKINDRNEISDTEFSDTFSDIDESIER